MHSHAFNSFIFTLSCENQKCSLILSDAVAETTEFREAERLDSLILINAVLGSGAKFGPFLINAVAEITELWVKNSQKINCHDVTSIPEGRVQVQIQFLVVYFNNLLPPSLSPPITEQDKPSSIK